MVERRPDGSIVLRAEEALRPYRARLHDFLFHWAEQAGDRTYLAQRGEDGGWIHLSYRDAAEQARRIAAALAERDLGPERPLLILSGNSLQHALLALGAMIAGVPYSPVSVAYSTLSSDYAKLRHILAILDPAMVYTEDAAQFAAVLQLPEMHGRELVVGRPSAAVPGTTPFSELLAGGSAERLRQAEQAVGPDSVMKIMFTSGSTGVPKGVITTHRMLCANLQGYHQLWPFMTEEPPVMLDWLPWNHVFGGNSNMGHVLSLGGTLYLDDGRPLPGEFDKSLRNLREVAPTLYWNVPKAFELLVAALRRDDELRRQFFSRLRVMFYAAAVLPEHIWRELDQLARQTVPRRISMTTGWGLTETAPSVTLLNRHGAEPGELGVPLPGVELKLVPVEDKLEARVRGPNVTPGYWRMPELTAKAFDEEGFFRTGDALIFIDPSRPELGFRFNGRITEDFKLRTGTWVNYGECRIRALKALGTLATDVVVAAPDRDELGLLIFPGPGMNADDPAYVEQVTAALREMNRGEQGSSRRIARAMIMREPASLDSGEMTDKGSLNVRAVLERRRELVERLYQGGDDVIVP